MAVTIVEVTKYLHIDQNKTKDAHGNVFVLVSKEEYVVSVLEYPMLNIIHSSEYLVHLVLLVETQEPRIHSSQVTSTNTASISTEHGLCGSIT